MKPGPVRPKWTARSGRSVRSAVRSPRRRSPRDPHDRPVTRMEKMIDENANLTDQVGHLQDQLDRHEGEPPEPSALEENVKTLDTRINALLADLDKERRLHKVTKERLKRADARIEALEQGQAPTLSPVVGGKEPATDLQNQLSKERREHAATRGGAPRHHQRGQRAA